MAYNLYQVSASQLLPLLPFRRLLDKKRALSSCAQCCVLAGAAGTRVGPGGCVHACMRACVCVRVCVCTWTGWLKHSLLCNERGVHGSCIEEHVGRAAVSKSRVQRCMQATPTSFALWAPTSLLHQPEHTLPLQRIEKEQAQAEQFWTKQAEKPLLAYTGGLLSLGACWTMFAHWLCGAKSKWHNKQFQLSLT